MKKPKPFKAWAWAIKGVNGEYELCYWIRMKKTQASKEQKPSPGAKLVRVEVRPI